MISPNDIDELNDAFNDAFNDCEDENTELLPSDVIPDKCLDCKQSTICSALTSYVNLLSIGIKIQVETCDFYRGK